MNREIPLFNMPIGPGSQQDKDDLVLDYMPMPNDMASYHMPILPEPEELETCPHTIALLELLQDDLNHYQVGQPSIEHSLEAIPPVDLITLNQILGEGEVSAVILGSSGEKTQIQETVLAGVWRLRQFDSAGELIKDTLEVADIPQCVHQTAFATAAPLVVGAVEIGADLLNAPSVLVELSDVSARIQESQSQIPPHVINLSLLPFSSNDQGFLAEQLGVGPVTILSRGYGNCRITSTASCLIWRVQYFNSTDQLILDTIEVSAMPQVACAAQEDIDDSAVRLSEIREVLV